MSQQDGNVGTIGVVIAGVILHDYLGEVFRGIADTAKQHGYSLITNIQNPRRHDNLAHLFAPGACDGVVVVLPIMQLKSWINAEPPGANAS